MSLLYKCLRNVTYKQVKEPLQYTLKIKNLKHLSTTVNETSESTPAKSKVGGFAEAFDKFSKLKDLPPTIKKETPFKTLVRNSKFVDLGDPEGKVLLGKIFHIVDNDLYIDYGGKFHCVCPKPSQKAERYVRGATVRIRMRNLELSTRFLGSEKDLTILEADAVLIGVVE